MKKIVRIGTRGSKLALYQANRVKEELEKVFPELRFEIEIIKTKGDIILDVPLSKIGDKGLFTKELENALFNNEIDMAVHSLKDLPTVFPKDAKLGAVLKRGETRDALISIENRSLSDLTVNDVIATSSLRRKAQLLRMNKDFKIIEIRGNVNTRIRKMSEGLCNVMVMAAAGLQRLDMTAYIKELIPLETMIPACSQGAIAMEIRANDPFISDMLLRINDNDTWITTEAERAFLRTLEGGCQIPVGSYSKIEGEKFSITGFISGLDGQPFYKDTANGNIKDAVKIATDLAKSIYERGGKKVLEDIRNINLNIDQSGFPLRNKVFISTRMVEQGDTLPELLASKGARLLSFPMIEVKTSALTDNDIALLKNLSSFDWIFFSSRNGVVNFFRQLIDLTGRTEIPSGLKIAAIGEKTALELEYYGYSAAFISNGNSSKEMADEFLKKHSAGNSKIILALGNLADDTLYNILSQGNKINRINVYDTEKPQKIDADILDMIHRDLYDMVLFTSPSTFHNFLSVVKPEVMSKIRMASIGSTTTKSMRDAGYEPLITASRSSAEGLVNTIIGFYNEKKK